MTQTLIVTEDEISVVRLPADAPWPSWLPTDGFLCVTRTDAELSIVCDTAAVPDGTDPAEHGWRRLELAGPFEFTLTGVLSSVLDADPDRYVGGGYRTKPLPLLTLD